MKKILIATLIIVSSIIVLTACTSKDNVRYLSKVLGINMSGGKIVEYTDTHGGFHGDGDTYIKVEFDDKASMAIVDELSNNPSWSVLPLSDNLHAAVYGEKYESSRGGYLVHDAEYKSIIPRIEIGYYYFYDRNSESKNVKDDTELFNRHSYNFTIAIYDAINQELYYYELDT
jgi:hypothetical protein